MTPLAPNEIKRIELSVLIELDRICAMNGLTYLLAYGSVLGAVRHGGFIPWDDDIDVYMPRADYEELIKIYAKGVDSSCNLVSYRDNSSLYQFAKLVDCSTLAYETFVGPSHPIGLWVDIFPLEPTDFPSSPQVKNAIACNKCVGLARSFAVADPSVGSSKAVILIKKIICPLMRHFSIQKLNRKLDKDAMAVASPKGLEASYVISLVGGDYVVFPTSVIFPTKPITFENHTFPGPANPEAYLSAQYGDWRTPPPENERLLHFPEAYLKENA